MSTSSTALEQLQALQQRPNQPILVEFVAPHCPSCEILAPILEQLVAEQAETVVLIAIDMTEEPEFAMEFGVRSAPTLIAFRGTTVVERSAGLKPKKHYSELIQSLK